MIFSYFSYRPFFRSDRSCAELLDYDKIDLQLISIESIACCEERQDHDDAITHYRIHAPTLITLSRPIFVCKQPQSTLRQPSPCPP